MSEKRFSADVEQLIELVTHSVYSEKEVFLRELVSNANDALQKARILSIKDPAYLWDDHKLQIKIDVDKKNNVITLSDNGVGMSQSDVEKNIGTIAKSGTKDFLKKLKKKKDENSQSSQLIGQFGIWFYSVFMVAKKVELETKSATWQIGSFWVSEGKGSYELKKSYKKTRGTVIKIFLNDDSKEFADIEALKSLVKKHSNYVPMPIMMQKSEEKKEEYEQVNAQKSLWTKQKSEVTKEEYKEFYQSLSYDTEDPLDTIHINVEWAISYKAVLFIPQKKNPFSAMIQPDQKQFGPSLYVQNVLILDQCSDLLPVWLRFVKGVVETQDLSLNISREVLQNSQIIKKIQTSLTKEVIKSLAYCKKSRLDSYKEFFTAYWNFVKEGVHYDFARKEEIASLLLFYSVLEKKYLDLDLYIESNKEDKKIYYALGKNLDELKSSPRLSKFLEYKKDVLLMDSPLDDWVVSALSTFKEYALTSIFSDVHLEGKEKQEENKKSEDKQAQENKDFIAYSMWVVGKEKLEKIKLVHDHKDVLAYFVHKDGEPTAQMQKMMKAMWQAIPDVKRTLACNLNHPLVVWLLKNYKVDPKSADVEAFVKYLYNQAILLDGGEVENMHDFLKTVNTLIKN